VVSNAARRLRELPKEKPERFERKYRKGGEWERLACFELASIMTDINMRVTMIEVARGWMRLAEQTERNSTAAYHAEYKANKAS